MKSRFLDMLQHRKYITFNIGNGESADGKSIAKSWPIAYYQNFLNEFHRRYPDVVLIETKLVAYNGVRMTLEYTVRDKETGEVRCTGETKHCFISREGNILRLTSSFPEIDTVVAGLLSEKREINS